MEAGIRVSLRLHSIEPEALVLLDEEGDEDLENLARHAPHGVEVLDDKDM